MIEESYKINDWETNKVRWEAGTEEKKGENKVTIYNSQ